MSELRAALCGLVPPSGVPACSCRSRGRCPGSLLSGLGRPGVRGWGTGVEGSAEDAGLRHSPDSPDSVGGEHPPGSRGLLGFHVTTWGMVGTWGRDGSWHPVQQQRLGICASPVSSVASSWEPQFMLCTVGTEPENQMRNERPTLIGVTSYHTEDKTDFSTCYKAPVTSGTSYTTLPSSLGPMTWPR